MAEKGHPRTGLPDYEQPPVAEVAVGVQFQPLPILAPHIGLYWSELRSSFPTVQQQPALEPVIERFGVKQTVVPSLRLMDAPETPRCFLIDKSGHRLIQLQPDRLIHNWRKVEDSGKYPHYDAMREVFLEELRRFDAFVAREKLGSVKPNQCEVTYVNNIQSSGVWEHRGQAERVFRTWTPLASGGSLPAAEDVRFSVRYLIADDKGQPLGRLHVTVQPAYLKKDGSEVFAMNLTARGAPEGEGIDGAMRFLDRAHRTIVWAFTDLTTETMHRVWGRKHGS
ncbi:MAG TPA: TIGR04255 family protein [Vicinamibacteria bacterium]|nr:TIGR04255 family protein [Vicinamibacteria bacterium]